ncbi:uncharacterized protein DFL_006502 [Arthrobotrys flagrans]|uniref:CCHC-type domain-containing protein n=1 Tax=Arthrobotrys flagrans TaxID=97331 RepID=A0A437A0N2_ARTFL|nr:hypothetical protein DFL_006502 [Arthrobotrys flagrans]
MSKTSQITIPANGANGKIYQHSKYGSCVQLNETNYLVWKPQIIRILKAADLYGLVTLEPNELEPQAMVTTFKPAYIEEPNRAGVNTRAGGPAGDPYTVDELGNVVHGTIVRIDTERRIRLEEPNPKHQAWKKRAGEAYMLLTNSLSNTVQQVLNHHGSAVVLWEAIQNTYGPRANHGIASNLFFPINNLQMGKEESIQQWIGRLRPIQEQLEGTPYAINDKIFRDKLLNGTQNRYDITTKSIWTQLARQHRGRGRGRGNYCGKNSSNSNRQNHSTDNNRLNNQEGSQNRSSQRCFYCTRKGHHKKDCRLRLKAEQIAQELRSKTNPNQNRSEGHQASSATVESQTKDPDDYSQLFNDNTHLGRNATKVCVDKSKTSSRSNSFNFLYHC